MANLIPILVALTAFSFNVLCTILFCRFLRHSLLKSVFTSFLLGLMCLILLNFISQGSLALLVLNGLIYGCLGYGYFHFLNLGETARRIRLLNEIHRTNGITYAMLLERYNAKTMVALRLKRLIDTGQIHQVADRFFIGRRSVLMMAQAMVLLKRIYLGQPHEHAR